MRFLAPACATGYWHREGFGVSGSSSGRATSQALETWLLISGRAPPLDDGASTDLPIRAVRATVQPATT